MVFLNSPERLGLGYHKERVCRWEPKDPNLIGKSLGGLGQGKCNTGVMLTKVKQSGETEYPIHSEAEFSKRDS